MQSRFAESAKAASRRNLHLYVKYKKKKKKKKKVNLRLVAEKTGENN